MKAFHVAALLSALAAAAPALAQEKSREPLDTVSSAGGRAANYGDDTAWSTVSAVTIADVQRRLKYEGYYIGEINGFADTNTESALLDFQTDRELALTGRMDQQTMASLGFPADTQQAQLPIGEGEPADTGEVARFNTEHSSGPNVTGQPNPPQRSSGVPAADEPAEGRGLTN